jgi:hypothetical protein
VAVLTVRSAVAHSDIAALSVRARPLPGFASCNGRVQSSAKQGYWDG